MCVPGGKPRAGLSTAGGQLTDAFQIEHSIPDTVVAVRDGSCAAQSTTINCLTQAAPINQWISKQDD